MDKQNKCVPGSNKCLKKNRAGKKQENGRDTIFNRVVGKGNSKEQNREIEPRGCLGKDWAGGASRCKGPEVGIGLAYWGMGRVVVCRWRE